LTFHCAPMIALFVPVAIDRQIGPAWRVGRLTVNA
jgi:hypothetical protein